MRILRVAYRLPPEPGGKERHVDRLTREQLARGHHVILAHRHGKPTGGAEPLPLAPTLAGRLAARRSDPVAFAMECARALPGVRDVDLVHLHGDHREALSLGPVTRRLGIPLVVTVHGALAARHGPVLSWAFRHVDGFVALGDRPANDLRAAGVPVHKIRTMSSGLDLAHLDGFRGRAPVEPGLIVSVGALEAVKNHALLIEAFHQVRAGCPWARLVIAGDGSERARLERLAGPDSGVEFAGHLSAERTYSLVGRAHAFVLASRRLAAIGEGVPTAALEALALGTPVIVSSDASLTPVVQDGGAYLTFRSGSRDELVARLRAVLRQEAGHPETAERGRRAVAALDWSQVASRVEECYETFMTTRSPRGARTPGRPHVCEVIKTLDVGGAEVLLVERLLATPHAGRRYTVVCLRASTQELIERLRTGGLPVVDLTSRPRALRLPALLATVRRLRPDVLNIHSPLPAALLRPVSRLWRPRPVLISTVHNVRCRRPTMVLDQATKWMDARTVAVSPQVARASAARGARAPFTCVHGVRVAEQRRWALRARETRQELGLPCDAFLITHVANFRPVKNHALLLDAAVRVVSEDSRALFALAGRGPLYEQIARRAAGSRGRVRMLGYVPDAGRLIAASDLLVLSSLHEGLPVVAMEALAAGVPVVSTAVGGVPDLIDHDRNGLLTSPGDAGALARGILHAMRPDTHARLRRGALDDAVRLDIDRTVAWFDKLYDEVCH
ncbi:hypothetical protein GCM10022226_17780 [Sphaerisporangium flaviroseum]|uniref:Glycosyltransferase n=1 Tax=Sphaerisporangium flaviroseum TaxID=509199 RepID=A0ABP7HNZ5_9ACTN